MAESSDSSEEEVVVVQRVFGGRKSDSGVSAGAGSEAALGGCAAEKSEGNQASSCSTSTRRLPVPHQNQQDKPVDQRNRVESAPTARPQGIMNVIRIFNRDRVDKANYAREQLEQGKSGQVKKMACQAVKNDPTFQECVRNITPRMTALCKDSIATAVNLLQMPEHDQAGAAKGVSKEGAPESMESEEEAGDGRDVDAERDRGLYRKTIGNSLSLFDIGEWRDEEKKKDREFDESVNAFLDQNLKLLEPRVRIVMKNIFLERFKHARRQTKDDFSACLGNVAHHIERLKRKKERNFFQSWKGQQVLPALELLRTLLYECTEAEMVMTYYLAGVCVGVEARKQIEEGFENFQKQTRQSEVHDMALRCISNKGSVQSVIEMHVSNQLCDIICQKVAENMKLKLQESVFSRTCIVDALKHIQGMKSAADGNIFRGPWEPLWALLGMDTTACIGTHNILLQARVEAFLMSALDGQQHIPQADVTLCSMCGYSGQCGPLVETSRNQFSPSLNSKECGLILLCPPGKKAKMSNCVLEMMNFRRFLSYLSITLNDVMGSSNTKYPPNTSLAAMLFCKPPELLSGEDHFHVIVDRYFHWVFEVCRQCAHVRKYTVKRCNELQAERDTLHSSLFSIEVLTNPAQVPQIEAQVRAKEAEIEALKENVMIPSVRQGEVTVSTLEIFEVFCDEVLRRMDSYEQSTEIPEELVFFVRRVFVMLNGGTGGVCTARVAEPFIRASGLFRNGEFSLDYAVWGGLTWDEKTNNLCLRELMHRIPGLENYRPSESIQTLMQENSKLKLAQQLAAEKTKVAALERRLAAMQLEASQETSLDANTAAQLLHGIERGDITFDDESDEDALSIIEDLQENRGESAERDTTPMSAVDSRHDTVDSRQDTVAGSNDRE